MAPRGTRGGTVLNRLDRSLRRQQRAAGCMTWMWGVALVLFVLAGVGARLRRGGASRMRGPMSRESPPWRHRASDVLSQLGEVVGCLFVGLLSCATWSQSSRTFAPTL